MYTYSGTPAALDATLTAVQAHHLMKSPTLLARRLGDITREGFIADRLLTGRYTAEGGAIAYPIGVEGIYPNDDAEIVAPGGQYPLTQMDSGQLAIARTAKQGLATLVYDEEISRMKMQAVQEAILKLRNSIIKRVDGTALAVIASKVTATIAATAPWVGGTEAANVRGLVKTIAAAKAGRHDLSIGTDPDVIVLKEGQFNAAMAELLIGGYLPRESAGGPLATGVWPQALGLTWMTSQYTPFTDPLLIDTSLLGGMADETIASPDYSRAPQPGANIEVHTERLAGGRDGWLAQARRVCVPLVTEPRAAVRITGTGL